ncbi:hypothetical protein M673_03890 [Aureimonas sp. AU20]|nr:hypothetical protein M673_03890 [Aureimonas sp. AU20]
MLTGGEVSDYKTVPALLAMPVGKPRLMPADKGYEGDEVRQSLLLKGVLPMIPSKANRRAPAACDFKQYQDRNRIERMFNRLKQARRIATRYDQAASSFLAFLAFLSPAPSRMWLRDYVDRSWRKAAVPKTTYPRHKSDMASVPKAVDLRSGEQAWRCRSGSSFPVFESRSKDEMSWQTPRRRRTPTAANFTS